MNPLPRYLVLALFVVLAALVILLAGPVWRAARADTSATAERSVATPSPLAAAPPARMIVLSQRVSLVLALVGAALTLALVVSLALPPPRPTETRPPFSVTRTEVGALARLAESSAAQGEELDRERGVRRRAEENAETQHRLLAQAVEEKVRLGRDLHDGIIQSLYAVGLTLESVRAILKSNPDEADRRLEQTRAGLNRAIRDVRDYITGLTPDNLRRASFTHAVSALVAELNSGGQAQFEIQIDDEAAALLTAEQSVEALQIAREAVSNALRHGRASQINVRVHKSDREVCLLVQDNGIGFEATKRREGGHGLDNMHARAGSIGASLRVTTRPGEGVRVLATLPILESSIV